MILTKHQARSILEEACAHDYAGSLLNDAGFRMEVAEMGFKGFTNMDDDELVQAALDADLVNTAERYSAVAALTPQEE